MGCVCFSKTPECNSKVMLLKIIEFENRKMLIGHVPTDREAIEYLQYLCQINKPNPGDIESIEVNPFMTFFYYSVPRSLNPDRPENIRYRELLKVEYLKKVMVNYVTDTAKATNMTLEELKKAVEKTLRKSEIEDKTETGTIDQAMTSTQFQQYGTQKQVSSDKNYIIDPDTQVKFCRNARHL